MPYYDVVLEGKDYTVCAKADLDGVMVFSIAEETTGRHLSEVEMQPLLADVIRQVEEYEASVDEDGMEPEEEEE